MPSMWKKKSFTVLSEKPGTGTKIIHAILIILLILFILGIIAIVIFFLLDRDDESQPSATKPRMLSGLRRNTEDNEDKQYFDNGINEDMHNQQRSAMQINNYEDEPEYVVNDEVADEEFSKQCLDAHNGIRLKHKVSPLKLTKQLNDYAKDWANTMAQRDQLMHRPNTEYGENLFSKETEKQISGKEPVNAWYNEIKKYNFDQKRELPDKFARHFTQLVWKGTKNLGCANARSVTGTTYAVAYYDPPGNAYGTFFANVFRPKKQSYIL